MEPKRKIKKTSTKSAYRTCRIISHMNEDSTVGNTDYSSISTFNTKNSSTLIPRSRVGVIEHTSQTESRLMQHTSDAESRPMQCMSEIKNIASQLDLPLVFENRTQNPKFLIHTKYKILRR